MPLCLVGVAGWNGTFGDTYRSEGRYERSARSDLDLIDRNGEGKTRCPRNM